MNEPNVNENNNGTNSQVISILLNKIDDTVIPPIREVDRESVAYKKLFYAFDKNQSCHIFQARQRPLR